VEESDLTPRPAPFFVGEHPALDFLNTVATPWAEPIEWLGSGRDLLDWLVRAKLVPAPVAQRYQRTAAGQELDAVARRARELREWFRDFVRKHAGRPLMPGAVRGLGRLNLLLRREVVYRQLESIRTPGEVQETPFGRVARWRWERRWQTTEALLHPMAEAIGDFVCRADFRFVRRCERCTLWFLDVSRGHGRRWCSMAVCGNRAKAAARRARS
jgi:predicted RNA-binding Zn ribbon-like protein